MPARGILSVAGIGDVLARSAEALRSAAPLLVVVNDRREPYADVLELAARGSSAATDAV